MDFLHNLFGRKKEAKPGPGSAQQAGDPVYMQYLKSEFGVDYREGRWAFEGGRVIDNMVTELSRPYVCLPVLKHFREKLPFEKVCIMFGPKMVALICNTKPTPTCFLTGLNASAAGDFLEVAVKEGGKIDVYENAPWLLTL